MKWSAFSIVLTVLCFVYSCKKSDSGSGGGGTNNPPNPTYTPNCTSAAIQFSANVMPIFQSTCAASGCHNSGSVNGPGALTSYAEINSAKVQIRAAVLSGAMPKTGTLTAAQKNSIICWIDAGAANN